MEYLRIRNWEKYQDTAGLNVDYVHLSTKILTDAEFLSLSTVDKIGQILCLVYAGIHSNKIPNDSKIMSRIFHLDDPFGEDQELSLNNLIEIGFLEPWDEELHYQIIDKYLEKNEKMKARWRESKRRKRSGIVSTVDIPPVHCGQKDIPQMSPLETKPDQTKPNTPPTPPSGETSVRKKLRKPQEPSTDVVNTMPDCVGEDKWRDFVNHRRAIKKPMTTHAQTLMLSRLAKLHREGHDPNELIDNAIMNGWQSVYPERGNGNGKKSCIDVAHELIEEFNRDNDAGATSPDQCDLSRKIIPIARR